MCDNHRFKFNMARAYKQQAVDQFEGSPVHTLGEHGAPEALGVYALYYDDKKSPIYVGKATKITLARRLTEHHRKINGRQNIDVRDMRCRYLVIDDEGEEWVAASAESHLIEHFKPKWNGSGFGGHTPGAGRPGVRTPPWDEWYPPKT